MANAAWHSRSLVHGGSQDHRPPLYCHCLRLSRDGRCSGDAHALAARAAGKRCAGARPVQHGLHHARLGHDVPVCRAGDGGGRRLPCSAHGRHAQHSLPQAQRVLLLDVSWWWHPAVDRLRIGHGSRCRLVRLRAAIGSRVRCGQAGRHLGTDDHLHRGLGARRGGGDRRHRI